MSAAAAVTRRSTSSAASSQKKLSTCADMRLASQSRPRRRRRLDRSTKSPPHDIPTSRVGQPKLLLLFFFFFFFFSYCYFSCASIEDVNHGKGEGGSRKAHFPFHHSPPFTFSFSLPCIITVESTYGARFAGGRGVWCSRGEKAPERFPLFLSSPTVPLSPPTLFPLHTGLKTSPPVFPKATWARASRQIVRLVAPPLARSHDGAQGHCEGEEGAHG